MKREPTAGGYPLSPMQQGMLFHNLSAREPGVDVEQIFCTLSEALDAAAFERAWLRVIERHEVLRTSFHWRGHAEPVQKVHGHAGLEFWQQDWRAAMPAAQQNLFENWLAAERQRGFDLAEPPLLRLALFRTGHAEWRFVWTFHHLLLDGRAVVTLLNEVFALYEAFSRGENLELRPPRPYHDFIEWLRAQDLSRAEIFWRECLRGFSAPTPLTTGQAAKGERQIGGEQQIEFSEATTSALKFLARENQFTLNTLIQGAWALLLSRYSGEEDVVFGAVRAGRHGTIEGAESIVGLCINTVPVRVHLSPDAAVLPWLAGLRNLWLRLREFEHAPLVKIQGWSEVPFGQPLFESILNFQDPSWDKALSAQGGKWASRCFGISSQSNYPLAVDAYGGDALLVKIIYHRPRFSNATIARMLGHFKTLLETIAVKPQARLAELPLLTRAERGKILGKWNDTQAAFPRDKRIHELFETRVARAPGALAVAGEEGRTTYGELNDRADLLAARLRECGVGPEVCVGVCMKRSMAMIAAKLAVWKAGGAYVPLDPSYPEERLAFMIADAQMPVLVTQKSLLGTLQFVRAKLQVLCTDDAPGEARRRGKPAGANSPSAAPNPHNLAYVIYTSGSTGQPKGVEIEHASLANLIAWHQRAYRVTPADRATQIATPAFDASVWELWPYLTAGASIHIPGEETRLSPGKLLQWLAGERITLAFVPTPLAEKMLNEPWPEAGSLRALLTGGDKLHRAPGKKLPCRLVNHYGPTENTVVTTAAEVPAGDESPLPPPIGRPIANNQVFILDRNLQPVPVGVQGELHIGGAGLARGYRHRPELTAEKFVPNPFDRRGRSRLYRTGDLVRWLPDGQIEFLGRLDHQVKVRGQRIELGEIESILARHPDVGEATVVPHADEKGENRLAAYVVPQKGRRLKPGDLREFLKQKLPDAMVPSAFVFLDALPLSPNGKVDRKALPAPNFILESEKPFVAPRSAVEEMLAGIWREVLGAGRVGVQDNFFELGGHSLTATQVVSRVFSAFQVELPLYEIFDSPTIAGLAQKIGAARAARSAAEPAKPEAGRLEGCPVSFAQERLWFMEQLEPGIPFNNIPVAFRLEGALNPAALEKSVSEILRRHAVLRSSFDHAGGAPRVTIAPAEPASIPVIDLSALPCDQRESEVRRLMAEQAGLPFNLGHTPLLRLRLLRLGAAEHVLLLTTHHLVCDGWSMGIFHRELAALYQAFSRGGPSPLPEPAGDYATFARAQREQLRGAALDQQLAFWKRQLGGAQSVLDLPADRPRPALQTYRGAAKYFALPAKLSTRLAQFARTEQVTPFMLLFAGFLILLHRYSGQEDILVGSLVAGRTRVDTEGLMGLFLNTLVLRGDLSGDPAFRDLLKRVRKVSLDAWAHQDLPFGKLMDALQPARDLSRSPLFQVMFILQNEPLPPLELSGLKLTPLPSHSGTAKFDLTLSLEETPGGLGGFIEYAADLFDESSITRLLGGYQTILESVVADAGLRLSQVPLLAEAERRRVLIEWNDTWAPFPGHRCIHHLFEHQARQTPDAVAVVFEGRQLTYRELNERTTRLARELQTLGVGPEVRVGICVQRSLEMLVGLLGILKAGGAYVPLDPAYPGERLAFMLQDSQAPVLVTQTCLRHKLKFPAAKLKVLCVEEAQEPARARSEPPASAGGPPAVSAENLAYVIYTSGSTGTPKGVMVTHRNVVNFFAGMNRALGRGTGTWLAVTSISFDISVLELFWTLANGFRVIIQPDEESLSSAAATPEEPGLEEVQRRSVSSQILRHDVTHLQCTPSLATTLVLVPEAAEAVRRLRKLLLGGEALPVPLARRLREMMRGELINMYGPTETTVWSATQVVNETGNSVPIGRPIANTQIYILDKNLQPVPPGVPGEILIGGEGVARGYLGRPELTAERFVPNPFAGAEPPAGGEGPAGRAAARLYKTGDLGRFRADGAIEFLGRSDHQVKIRGHRIELGEVELALSRHPAVREVVVVAREEAPGGARLVAYVVPVEDAHPTATELRRFAQSQLPEAMTPSAFVQLDALPLTPNGKVNHRALPAPESGRPTLETAYVAPQARLEQSIARIWEELLHVDKVGVRDNFFDLGGNSLLVVQAQVRLRDAVGFDLPVVRLFQHPTIHALAAFLNERAQPALEQPGLRGQRKRAAFGWPETEGNKVMS